jgi:ubiquinone/menaquinone biosynthesis C-methylase UbiE/uncharacterized protein YbaR (Trm112 family)
VITRDWADILVCSRCSMQYDTGADDVVVCPRCSTRFPVMDDIPVLLDETTTGTNLDEASYEEKHGINDRVISKTGEQWSEIIERLGVDPGHALEIGAGSGVLTRGLLRHKAVRQVTAIDVSHRFLQMVAARTADDVTPVSLVACDANDAHFRSGSFDFVFGRSILHHLLDYDITISQCHRMLKPGGAAVFFEPVLDGKTVVTLLMALVLGCAEAPGSPLTPDDRQRIQRQIRHQTKSKTAPQDRESLAKMEDKYVFEIDALRQVGLDAGFSSVDVLNNGDVDPTYWPYLSQTFRVMGVAPEKIKAYRWIGEAFANTYGLMFPDKLVTPMAYFVFRK